MAVIDEGIRIEQNNTLSFGNFLVKDKLKVAGFEFGGDVYKIKTHNEVTKLEKNGKILIESVPGAAFFNFQVTEQAVSFEVDGLEAVQLTLELEPESDYGILVDGVVTGNTKSSVSGKISFSLELGKGAKSVRIEKL